MVLQQYIVHAVPSRVFFFPVLPSSPWIISFFHLEIELGDLRVAAVELVRIGHQDLHDLARALSPLDDLRCIPRATTTGIFAV